MPQKLNSSRQRTKNIYQASLSFVLSTGTTLTVGLILTGLLARYFSPEEFGLWSILMSLNGILITGFDLGFGNALRNKLAKLYSRDQEKDPQSQIYFFSIFYCFLLGAFILTVLFIFLKHVIPWPILLNSLDPRIIREGSSLMILGACILAFNLAFNLYTSGFFGYQESHWNALLSGLSRLALLLSVLLFVFLTVSFSFINFMFFLIPLLSSVVSFHIFLRIRKWEWKRIPFLEIWDKAKDLWRKSAQFALLQIFSIFLLNADLFVISKVLGLEKVGDYFIVKRLYLVMASFHFALLVPLWSAYTESMELKDFAWIDRILRKTILYTILIFIGGLLGMIFIGDSLVYWWTGKRTESLSLFIGLGIWALIYGWNNCFSVFLNGTGNLKRQVIFIGLGSVAFIPLSLLWGEQFGIIGVCCALIVVSLPVSISNPLQSAAILATYIKGRD